MMVFLFLLCMATGVTRGDGRGISAADSVRYNYFFIETERQLNASHFDAAFDLLEHCLTINPNASEAWYLRSMFMSEMKKDSLAMANLKKAVSLNPKNSYYQERLAELYVNAKDYTKAEEVYEAVVADNHERVDLLGILAQLYQQDREYDKMLKVVNRIESVEGNSEELTLTKMRIYEAKGDKKSAWKALRSLSDEHPSDLNYKVMMGNWLMQNNKQKKAYKIFQKALKEEPDNSFVQTSMYDYYQAVGEDSLARQMMEDILMSSKTSTETKATMMRQVIQDNQRENGDSLEVKNLFDKILQANPQDADMAELKAVYMSLKQFPLDSVNQALRDVLKIAPDNAGVRLQIIQNLWPKKDWDQIIELCKPAVQYNPDEMAFYYFMGLSYYQKDDEDNALDAFRRGVDEINDQSNKEIVSDFYAIMGDILHKKGLDNDAFAAYDSCLQWKDDNIGALNNYAYFLSLKGNDLQKAEQMSYKTVKAEPTNPTYLDTYAWILFKQERFAEAQIYIDQALANDTDSLQSDVIIEHAGDIYAMNGDMEKAVELWKKAQDAGSDNPILPQKINEKRYIKNEDE